MGEVISLFSAARVALETGDDVRRAVAADNLVQPTKYPVVRPRDVLPHPRDLDCMAAWDVEASGLFVDDGARVAAVSVAYSTNDDPETIHALAFPFDQGRPEDKGFSMVRDRRGDLKVDLALSDPDKYSLVGWDGVHVPSGFVGYYRAGRPTLRVDVDAWTRDVNLGPSDWADLMRWLKLAGEYAGLVAHNSKYDLLLTDAGTRTETGVDLNDYLAWDSMLACRELWPTESIALKATAARLWGSDEAEEAQAVRDALLVNKRLFGLVKDDGPRYDLLPWDVNGPYAAQDARLTLRLAKHQTDLLEEGQGSWTRIDRDLDLARTLHRIETRGFGPLDVEGAREVATAIEERINQLEAAMPFDPPTAYKAKEYFFDDLGLRPWRGAEEHREIELYTNKAGRQSKRVIKQGSLSVDVAGRMAEQGVPFAAQFAELLRLRTANQMHYRGYVNLAGPDNRLRTSFKQVFVRSGRMSVERFQAQAIPRRDSVKLASVPTLDGPVPHPRDLFLTPAGRRRATIDLSQAELRVAAQFSECRRMIEQVREGRDLHGEMATQIFGVTREAGHDKECGCATCSDFTHHRYISKRAVFGGIFMIGPKTFRENVWKQAQLWLPWDVCKRTIDGFRSLYPEIESEYVRSQDFVEENGYVELVDGTRSWFGPRDYPNTAWNRRVQGSLALFNAHWLVEVEARTAEWDALVLSVHDSCTLDLPEDVAEQVISDVREWTAAEFERWFGIPGATDVEWGF